MIGFLKFLITLPLTLALAYWCLSNLSLVEWSFIPFQDGIETPLAFIIFGFFGLGFITAVLLFWLNTIPNSFKRTQLERENKKIKKKLADCEEQDEDDSDTLKIT